MSALVLSQYSGAILGPIAKVLGVIINGIYNMLSAIGIPNVALSIILFTILINVAMIPLTIKQQKFQKLSSKMNPEITKIKKKYEGKRDQESIQRMNDETSLVYEKYGVSPSGGCLPLLIQMPVLFALFRVINSIPGYITGIKELFTGTVEGIMATEGYQEIMTQFVADNKLTAKLNFETAETTKNTLIDVLYSLKSAEWTKFEAISQFSGLNSEIETLHSNLSRVTNFLGLSVVDTPINTIKAVMTGGSIVLAIIALMIPILSAISQYASTKLMSTASTGDDSQAQMMKQMNITMPIMSAFFCFSFQVGLGIYWVASALARMGVQLIMNKVFDDVDVDKIIEENQAKAEKKKEKRGYTENQITTAANVKARAMKEKKDGRLISKENEEAIAESYKKEAKSGSIADRARMVQRYNDKNSKR